MWPSKCIYFKADFTRFFVFFFFFLLYKLWIWVCQQHTTVIFKFHSLFEPIDICINLFWNILSNYKCNNITFGMVNIMTLITEGIFFHSSSREDYNDYFNKNGSLYVKKKSTQFSYTLFSKIKLRYATFLRFPFSPSCIIVLSSFYIKGPFTPQLTPCTAWYKAWNTHFFICGQNREEDFPSNVSLPK